MVSRAEIVEQVERILASHPFSTSKRCKAFLRYVVQHASDDLEMLKERTIGVEVFGREPHYDTNQDPVVRITAGEVRKRLAQYYMEPAHQNELRISLPAGSYVVDFQHVEGENGPASAWTRARNRRLILAVFIVAATLGWALVFAAGRASPMEQFWAPVLDSGSEVVICVGQPQVFDFKSAIQQNLDRRFGQAEELPHHAAEMLNDVSVDDMVPMWDRYVVLGDAIAIGALSAFFAREGKPFQVRGARATSLGDLRGQPAVLIGAFNNRWTLNLTGDLRYYFESDSQTSGLAIRDRENPEDDRWLIADSWPKWEVPVDYGVVTRVSDSTTEQTIVVAAGITQYGTIAAAEFLTGENYLSDAFGKAPEDWVHRNMQVVISTKVIDGESGPPTVEAMYFWD